MKKILLIITLFSLQTFADRIPATTPEPNEMLERHENSAETGGLIMHEGMGCVGGCIAMKKSGKAKHTWSTETNFTPGGSAGASSGGTGTGER